MPGQDRPVLFTDPDIISVGQKHSASPSQVLISWGVKRGIIVIPKSENVDRMKANITVRPVLLVWVAVLTMCAA